MRHRACSFRTVDVHAFRMRALTTALVAAALGGPGVLPAQSHEHAAPALARDARLELTLGGPHLILYHRGYLALDEKQVSGLQPLRRVVCEAEAAYVEQSARWRGQLSELLVDSATRVPPRQNEAARPEGLQSVMSGLAAAESQWLTVLLQTRRDALALLTAPQRAQADGLRDHWARESVAMIEQATRPAQRGHPGRQIPIRVPGMVVGATTLLPYCEAMHGPSLHISIPPPR